MSRATKKKHVAKEILEELVEPEGNQLIVKVLGGRGNNLHEIETDEGIKFLVSMPTKFRRNVWIKRGDFVIVEPIAEGVKVKAEIVHILYPLQMKHLKHIGMWPSGFIETKTTESNITNLSDRSDDVVYPDTRHDDDTDDDDIFVNTNRPPPTLGHPHHTTSSEEEN